MLHGLPDVTLQSTQNKVKLHGLREVMSERQVRFTWSICNLKGFYAIKWQEMHNIHLFYNKTIVDLWVGRHGVLLNSKFYHIDLRSTLVNMMFTVQ